MAHPPLHETVPQPERCPMRRGKRCLMVESLEGRIAMSARAIDPYDASGMTSACGQVHGYVPPVAYTHAADHAAAGVFAARILPVEPAAGEGDPALMGTARIGVAEGDEVLFGLSARDRGEVLSSDQY